MFKAGLIGFGAIGKDVANYIKENKAGDIELKAILVRNKDKYKDGPMGCTFYDNEEEFFQLGLDFIIENAGHEAVYQYANRAFSSGSHFLVVSVGAFNDTEFLKRTEETAKEYNRQLIFPSAAIGGLDRIAAASLNDIDQVSLVTKKPPKAWIGTFVEKEVDLFNLTEPQLIYDGTARESSKLFPESTNVSAALALAGIGFDKTKVQVYVDPTISRNTHQIITEGFFGKMEIQVQNIPSKENPKSGYIVAMSICKVLKNYTSPIVIGI
ncbi:aspartate dehydrogenase [Bacillus sp. 03113]|uniref:aspartate dehydrogenase n=1 Tax=Bacillus sp. 03113 TaxID=2578211 RepID=UPI0011413BF2|nr:aspartate dehydrogenase [Bacillus sp. 03113]